MTQKKAAQRTVKAKRRASQGAPTATVVRGNVQSYPGRVLFVMSMLALAFVGVSGRLVLMGLSPAQEPEQSLLAMRETHLHLRGDILDRNGEVLATTLQVNSLYADPAQMLDPEEAVQKLRSVFPALDWGALEKRFQNKRSRFVWVKRHLTPQEVRAVYHLGVPGLSFRKEEARIYPQQRLAAHVLGGVNTDGRGLSGIELSMNDVLARGENVRLTLDARLQAQLYEVLKETHERVGANAVWGVSMDPATGDVLAMVNLPDYDPHHYGAAPRSSWYNNVTQGVYEMGSTFKVLTMAQALEERIVDENTEINCIDPIRISRFTIRDFYPKRKMMKPHEVLRYSSNIGASRIADQFDSQNMRAFYGKLNLLSGLELGLPASPNTLYPAREWGRIYRMTMSYGHGISVTPLHLAAAFSALVGDGHYRSPVVLADHVHDAPRQVVSESTVRRLRSMLRDVVQEGSGRNAAVVGYDVGGKTGTAEKSVAGGYDKNSRISSFIGAVPMSDPQLVTLIMVDENSAKFSGGGRAAAPAFRTFVERAIPLIALAPQQENEPVFVKREKKEVLANAALKPFGRRP